MALANPKNMPSLDLETECSAIKESVASQPGVEVKFLDHATLDAMLKELEKTPFVEPGFFECVQIREGRRYYESKRSDP